MYLGLDLGTSSVKAIVMSETGEVVAEASEPLRCCGPDRG